ncbi:Os04g0119200, partial [Oryza sativa Japonica Group]
AVVRNLENLERVFSSMNYIKTRSKMSNNLHLLEENFLYKLKDEDIITHF